MNMRKWKEYSWVIALYSALAVLFTYPLAAHIFTHIPGQGTEGIYYVWNLWWMKKALLELHTNPFYSNYVFYPNGIELLTYNYMTFNNLVSLPLQGVFSVILINNIFALLTFVLSGFGAFLLARYLTGNVYAAVFAGIVYGFCPYHYTRMAQDNFDLLNMQWIPFYALYLIKALREQRRTWNIILAGVFLALTAMCHYYYMVFLLMFTCFYLAYELIAGAPEDRIRKFTSVVLISAVFALLMLPLLVTIAKDIRNNAFQTTTAEGFLRDKNEIADFIKPNQISTLLGIQKNIYSGGVVERVAAPGIAALLLLLFAAYKRGKKDAALQFWLFSLFIFGLLQLGPSTRLPFFGHEIRLYSYIIFEKLPIFNAVRVPSRFTTMTLLCFAVISGYALKYLFEECRAPAKRYFYFGAAAALTLAEFLSIPVPLYELKVPAEYNEIAKDKEDCALLDIPIGWVNSNYGYGNLRQEFLYFQTIHQKRLLQGGGGRSRADKVQYYMGVPVIDTILKAQDGEILTAEEVRNDAKLADSIIRFYKLKYIVFHKQYSNAAVDRYLKSVFPQATLKTGSDIDVYEFNLDGEGPPRDTGAYSRLWYGYGWVLRTGNTGGPGKIYLHISSDKISELYLYCDKPRDVNINLQMQPLPYGNKEQELAVEVNGKKCADIKMISELGIYSYPVKKEMLASGINRITLKFKMTTSSFDKSENALGVVQTGIVVVKLGLEPIK
jgi:hypothetical protein